MKTRFMDAVQTLEVNGYGHLGMAALNYYDKMTTGMGIAQRARVVEMFDEVLTTALLSRDSIHPAEILLSQDFTYIKALARMLQELELVDGSIYELTDEDLVELAA